MSRVVLDRRVERQLQKLDTVTKHAVLTALERLPQLSACDRNKQFNHIRNPVHAQRLGVARLLSYRVGRALRLLLSQAGSDYVVHALIGRRDKAVYF